MAKVQRTWFRILACATGIEPLFDLSLGKDHDFEHLVHAAVAEMSFDDTFANHGADMSLRMTYVHMIGGYARHNGHADIMRQAIDGVTGR